MQRVPPVFSNGIRPGDKIPNAGRHEVPLNATAASKQHCGSPTFCPVRASRFRVRIGLITYIIRCHTDEWRIFVSILPHVFPISRSIVYYCQQFNFKTPQVTNCFYFMCQPEMKQYSIIPRLL